MFAVGLVLERRVLRDPGQREIGLRAPQFVQRGGSDVECPAMAAAAVSMR
jgi:hypothetical protein